MKYLFLITTLFMAVGSHAQAPHKKAVAHCNSYYHIYAPAMATDSVLSYLPRDAWFNSLPAKDRDFRLLRIRYYQAITRRRPVNAKYLKGWVQRAIQ